MIPELGFIALILALAAGLLQTVFGLATSISPLATQTTKRATDAYLVFLVLSFACLLWAFATTDLSVALVALHSHSLKPMVYKLAATWGSHEGSMLLWMLVLAVFGTFIAHMPMPADLRQRAMGMQGLLGFGFAAFTILTSSPFARVAQPPFDGNGLNPVLQDIGLALHPPTLYVGYVGFSSAWSLAAAGLMIGRIDGAWARIARLPVTVAWTALSAGIAAGSWWAFYELGWGGWWFWDPVENASLLPWLAGTALLHSLSVLDVRGALKRWTVFLSLITFCLSLLGTFLVRSGVLTSVHAFATDPTRGLFILGMLAFYGATAFSLYAWRAPSLRVLRLFTPASREGALVANNLLLVTMCATVLLGTLFPIVSDMAGWGQISVGAPYFNAVMIPLVIPLLLLIALAPYLPWKRLGAFRIRTTLLLGVIPAAILTIIISRYGAASLLLHCAIGAACYSMVTGIWYMVKARSSLDFRKISLSLSHVGLGIAIIGMIGSTVFKIEDLRLVQLNTPYQVAGHTLSLMAINTVQGENYTAEQGTIKVDDTLTMLPERRFYPVAGQSTTEAAIHMMGLNDLYVVLGDKRDGGYVIRTYIHPFVAALWGGFALIVLSGLFSILAAIRGYRQ